MNIRDCFETEGHSFIGRTVVEISSSDPDELPAFVQLIFDDASWMRFPVNDDGFEWNDGKESA